MCVRACAARVQRLRRVFAQSKERARELHAELAYDGIRVDVVRAPPPPGCVCVSLSGARARPQVHGERTHAQRAEVLRKFRCVSARARRRPCCVCVVSPAGVRARSSGEVWVLIATDMLARGMDFKGINLIINYDFPQVCAIASVCVRRRPADVRVRVQSTVSYVHRIGRTGRAGTSCSRVCVSVSVSVSVCVCVCVRV